MIPPLLPGGSTHFGPIRAGATEATVAPCLRVSACTSSPISPSTGPYSGGSWTRAAAGVHEARNLKVIRFGDNMREVADTDGDKVEVHEDFYDMGAMLYEQLPVLGNVTRWLRMRLAS